MEKNKQKILIFGRGQMAGFLSEYLENAKVSSADITKIPELENEFEEFKPDVVINTAAKTSIDWCEINKKEAFEINSLGAANIWELCKKHGAFMCHFSSGCIFSSRTNDEIFNEDSLPNPGCYYSWTKVWAENLLGKSTNLLVLRPRVVISSDVSNRNTLSKWMVYSHFITDQNTVSVVEDMLPIIKDMIERRICGTFNIANKGTISPLEAAAMLKKYANPDLKITATTLQEVNSNLVAKRVTTVLTTAKLENLGYSLPEAKSSVEKTIKKFKERLDDMGGLSSLDKMRQEAREKFELSGRKPTTFDSNN